VNKKEIDGSSIRDITGARRIGYRLSEWRSATEVFITEEADSLRALNLVTMTNPIATANRPRRLRRFFKGKQVVIFPEHDEVGIQRARELAESVLPTAGSVKIIDLLNAPEKGGITDYLATHSKDEFIALVMAAKPLSIDDIATTPDKNLTQPRDTTYRIEAGEIVRFKQTKYGPVVEALCNFTASLDEEIVFDDGITSSRAFSICGRLSDGTVLRTARVPASKFAGMTWLTEEWGARAIVRAGLGARDCLREATNFHSHRLAQNGRRMDLFVREQHTRSSV
jgi:hypothetical protein